MRFRIEVVHHISPELQERLSRLELLGNQLLGALMATPQDTNPLLSDPNFQELVSAVTSANGIMDSSAVVMNSLAAKIEAGAAAGDTTALRALAQQLRDHAGIVGAAIEANSGLVAAAKVASISVDPASLSLNVGDVKALDVKITMSDGTAGVGLPVAFSSSDDAIAHVGPDGVVAALAPGSATILAGRDGVSASVSVSVAAAVIQPPVVEPPAPAVVQGSAPAEVPAAEVPAPAPDAAAATQSGEGVVQP